GGSSLRYCRSAGRAAHLGTVIRQQGPWKSSNAVGSATCQPTASLWPRTFASLSGTEPEEHHLAIRVGQNALSSRPSKRSFPRMWFLGLALISTSPLNARPRGLLKKVPVYWIHSPGARPS